MTMTRNVFIRALFLAALLLASGRLALAQPPQAPATQPTPKAVEATPRNQNLQILLLSASLKPSTTAGPEIPENAQKALNDLKKFLPFKSYQLVDGAWLSATEGRSAQGRLAGNNGAAYKVELRFRATGDTEPPTLFVDGFRLEQEMVVQMQGGPQFGGRRLIDTTFSVKEGETIVVGTSKADGADGALVVLLTAVPGV
jgi:hypothetical protein